MPSRKPTVAGTTDMRPMSSDSSMLGMSSDHTEAATITPDAKPSSTFCSQAGIVSRMKNTKPAPSTVPTRGMSNPMTNPSMPAKLDIFPASTKQSSPKSLFMGIFVFPDSIICISLI